MPAVFQDTKMNVDIVGGLIDGLQLLTKAMADPDAAFVSGEWVAENAEGKVAKIGSGSAAIVPEPHFPRMIWGGTDRHDVSESDSLTCLKGLYRAKTMKYKTGNSFAVGDKLVIYWDGTNGILTKIGTGDTFTVVGEVVIPPTVDGTDYLVFEAYGTPVDVTVS